MHNDLAPLIDKLIQGSCGSKIPTHKVLETEKQVDTFCWLVPDDLRQQSTAVQA